MSREPDSDELEEATDNAFDLLESARPVTNSDDEIESLVEQEIPTAGGDDVTLEFDEDSDVGDPEPRAACRFCQEEFHTVTAERSHHSEDRCDQESPVFRPDGRPLIDPQLHKFGGHFLFVPGLGDLRGSQDGMAPYFGIVSQFDRCLQEDGEDYVGSFESAGDSWVLNHDEDKVKYWQGQIETRPGDVGDAYYEYQIGVVAEDAVGRKRINFQFRPSLPEATNAETGERIQSMPADLPEGIRVQVESANVEPEEMFGVLRDLMREIDVDPAYFDVENLHEHSRVTGLELYVRAVREIVEKQVVETGALFDRLAQFSSVRRGRGEYVWDNEEIIGHRHAVAMNETSLGKLYRQGEHEVGKLLKSYLMKNPEKQGGPTAEPKIEVQWNKEYSDYLGGNAVPWIDPDGYDFEDLRDELDEHLMFALNAAELPLRADPTVYVADEYWDVEESERDVAVHSDPTEELKEAEEDLTRAQLAREDLTPTDRAVIKALADGGQQHYEQIVEKTDTSSSSVYRSIDKFGTLVEKVGRGTYDLADDVVREKIEDVFHALEDVTEWVERGIEAVVEGSGEIADDSALAKWARRHGAILDGHHDNLEVELTGSFASKYEIRKLLRFGLQAAQETGAKTRARFVDGSFTFRLNGERRPHQEPFHHVGDRLFCLGARTER
ncbi:DUF7845 domain-containing protein [Natrarchaeobius chitinivorans]|uniref:DUF7845 domain-containing protein n=1 Tax=Natrarchaeobius chitinivorans TaxID=1679083 RepID=A0A3N6M0Z4_NATCH|nr:hypothetical protein [Natrarchaeobius chitinivorans]RQG89350.1 hypothetical protein EA473_22355 [Natrarchaeobius chitinivorans]